LVSLDKKGNPAKRKCTLLLSSFDVAVEGSVLCQLRKPKAVHWISLKEMIKLLNWQ